MAVRRSELTYLRPSTMSSLGADAAETIRLVAVGGWVGCMDCAAGMLAEGMSPSFSTSFRASEDDWRELNAALTSSSPFTGTGGCLRLLLDI
jgi:hypothetical protein